MYIKPPLNEMNLMFIDTETTGLDETTHEIIEAAYLIYSPTQDKIIDEFESKIAPAHIKTASQEALKINGYINNPGAYTGCLKTAMIKINAATKGCIIVGQNPQFDVRFIKESMINCGIEPTFLRHRVLDLMAMAWFAVKDAGINSLSLASLCEHFNISNVGAHGALTDCKRAFELYAVLASHYGGK